MNVKQSQLQPFLLSPIACGLILHTHTRTRTKERRKRSLCKACFTYRHQMWQQDSKGWTWGRGRCRGTGATLLFVAAMGLCLSASKGSKLWDISKATRNCQCHQRLPEGYLRCLSVFECMCAGVCGWCVPSDMSANALAICFTAFDSRYSFCIWFDNNAFQNGLPSALPSLSTAIHTHIQREKKLIWLSRQSHSGARRS